MPQASLILNVSRGNTNTSRHHSKPFVAMDSSHFNCRDYHIDHTSLHSWKATHSALVRHESWSDLEFRARSPASRRPKFPLLALPLELRQHILRYVLPSTTELRGFSPRASRVSETHKQRKLPLASTANVAWHKGNTALLAVCQQLHAECADLIYSSNTFILFVTFSGICLRFRHLLPNGLSPINFKPNFLEWIPPRYLALMRKLVIHVDHVDQYTGQIKYNVGGKGLVYGMQREVQRLVDALSQPTPAPHLTTIVPESIAQPSLAPPPRHQITQLTLCISNGSAASDSIKTELERSREPPRVSKDLETMLSPFLQMRNVRKVSVCGAITAEFAAQLEAVMRSDAPVEGDAGKREGWVEGGGGMQDGPPGVQMCVYGNHI